jgi:hypothetical protein
MGCHSGVRTSYPLTVVTVKGNLPAPTGPKSRSWSAYFERSYYNDKLVWTVDGWRIAERIEEPSYATRRHRIMSAVK